MTIGRPATSEGPRRRLPKTDIDVFPLGLGGNVFGSTVDEARGFEILDAYLEAGGNLIDTADSYCAFMGTDGGESETIIGNWLRSRGVRDRMVIASKVGQAPGRTNLKPDTIRAAVEGSLRRLNTDHIDIYYAHEDRGDPLDDTLETFDALQRAGMVRYIAASNYSGARLEDALAESATNSWAPYVALQPLYNLLDRADYERDLAPVVEQHGLGVFPYFSLASGYLTGKYRPGAPPVDTIRIAYVEPYRTERNDRIVAVLGEVAAECGVSYGAVALAWLRDRPGVVAPLTSVSSVGQLDELLAMLDLRLTHEQRLLLDDVSAPEPTAVS